MRNIIYYISGHGYGHATRSIELIRTLLEQKVDLFFHIRTNAPEWIFKLNLKSNYTLYPVKMDIGAVQNNSFEINKSESFKQVANLYHQKELIVKREADFALNNAVQLVISDIPSLAFDIAEAAGIPGVALTNFSWDWIYQDYVKDMPEFAELVRKIRISYRKADLLLRLPFYGDLSVFPKIKDIPLIARKAAKTKEEVWQLLEISPKNRPTIILIALRASDLEPVNFDRVTQMGKFIFITFGLNKSFKNTVNIAPDFLRFPDLLNASDVVVSKPGYGIVSEVIAHQTPILYTSRDDFVEYEVLVQGLKQFAVSNYLPREDFFKGNWEKYLNNLLNQKKEWKKMTTNGAEMGAEEILRQFFFSSC